MGRKKKNLQQTFRSTKFTVEQYWLISYTERSLNSSEKDFRTIIKAKSYGFAKQVLRLKIENDDPSVQVKSVQGFMLHKNYTMSPRRKPLRLKEWEEIHDACFPNENDHLFKIEMPRPEWKSNRFNGSGKNNKQHIKKHGFKKGQKNWAYINSKGKLPLEERSHKIWAGKWIEWKEEDRESKKNEIIDALNSVNNRRDKTAEVLGIHRNKLYQLFKKFPEINWFEEYPAPPPPIPARPSKDELSRRGKKAWKTIKKRGKIPFGGKAKSFSQKSNLKRANTLRARAKQKRLEKFKKIEPELRMALVKNNNSRKASAAFLGIKVSTFCKYLHQMKKEMGINWSKEYPNKNSNNKYKNE